MATVPVTHEYAVQKGRFIQLAGLKALTIFAPNMVHRAVPKTDTLKYFREVLVSGSKQSAGMTALRSFALGKSESFHLRALPLSPLMATPVMSKGSSTTSISSSIFGAGGVLVVGGSIARAYRLVLLVVAVVGLTNELGRTDWKADAVLAHDIANSVVAWENLMVVSIESTRQSEIKCDVRWRWTISFLGDSSVFFADDQHRQMIFRLTRQDRC